MESNNKLEALERAARVVRKALKIHRRMCAGSADRMACDRLMARLMDAERDVRREMKQDQRESA